MKLDRLVECMPAGRRRSRASPTPSMPNTPASPTFRAVRDMDSQLGDGGMPLLAAIGLAFDAYGDGWSQAAWTPTAMACNPLGIVHGGVYGVTLDAAMNFALNAALDRGDRASTLQ